MKRMSRFFSMRGFWGRIFSFGVRFLELFLEFGLVCEFGLICAFLICIVCYTPIFFIFKVFG